MKTIHPIQAFIEAIISAAVFVLLLGVSTHLIYAKSVAALEAQIKSGLQSTVQAAATTIQGSIHRQFNQETLPNSPAYSQMAAQLEAIRQASNDVRYIYTCILRNGQVLFIVNPSPQNDGDGDGLPDTPPALMTPYQDAPNELLMSLQHEQTKVSAKPYQDQWGRFISAYAPFYDADGIFVGVLAMDLELKHYDQRLESIEKVFDKANIIIVFLGLIMGLTIWWIRLSDASYFNNRLKKKQITMTQLQYAERTNNELLWLVEYFYQSLPAQSEASTALYHYTQSLIPDVCLLEYQNLTQWFTELTQWLAERHIQLERHSEIQSIENAAFYAQPLLQTLTQLLPHFVSGKNDVLVMETRLTEETLTGWQLTNRCYLNDKARDNTFVRALCAGDWDLSTQAHRPNPITLQARTLRNTLSHLDVTIETSHPSYIDWVWIVYKEEHQEPAV